MFRNPVYQKETKIVYRSLRTIIVILVFNALLAVVGISLLAHMVNNINFNGSTEYSAMLQLYLLTSALEFCLLMLIMPGQTAGSISGERERKTLETMLSTNMTASTIVMGKLEASLSTTILMIISGLPILSLVFIYGGIQFTDLLMLLIVLLLNALYIGSAGICFSAHFRRTTTSTVASYAFLFIILAGTLLLSRLPNFTYTSQTEFVTSAGGNPLRWYSYFLLINPAVTFYYLMNLQAGDPNALFSLIDPMGFYRTNFITDHWISISMGLQFLLTCIFLASAIRKVRLGVKNR